MWKLFIKLVIYKYYEQYIFDCLCVLDWFGGWFFLQFHSELHYVQAKFLVLPLKPRDHQQCKIRFYFC